ncbi:hypothetical protein [Leptolyngbya sp. GB1-A1]
MPDRPTELTRDRIYTRIHPVSSSDDRLVRQNTKKQGVETMPLL